jgi:hypothetical protein
MPEVDRSTMTEAWEIENMPATAAVTPVRKCILE